MSLFLKQLGWELFRMFARKRTYIGFGVFVAVELVIYTLLTLDRSERNMERWIERVAGGFDHYFSALTLAFMIVAFTMLLLGAVFVSLVTGDIVAKETEDGNLRLLLVRPVSRLRLLLVKFLACQLYAIALFWFVGLTAFLVGLTERGWGGGMFVWTPELPRVSIFEWNEGLFRYFLAVTAFVIAYLPITGIAFALSCLKIKPAAATIVTIAYILADSILSKIPLPIFEDYQHWFITPKMQSWALLLYQDIPWPRVLESWMWLVGFGVTGFVVGWVIFERRDVKS